MPQNELQSLHPDFFQPRSQPDRIWSFWSTHLQHADFCICALFHPAPETYHVLSSLGWQSILTYAHRNWTKVEAIGKSNTKFINKIPHVTTNVKIRLGEEREDGRHIYPDQPNTFLHFSFYLYILLSTNIIISINWCLKVWFHEFCTCNNFKYVSFGSFISLPLVLTLMILTANSWKPPIKVFTIHT